MTEIGADRLTLTNGSVPAPAGSLYVDCTASALTPRAAEPVFQRDRIVVQAIRFPQIPFSAAFIGYLEATSAADDYKNSLTVPVPVITTVTDYIRAQQPDLENRLRAASDPGVRTWIRSSRLDGFARIAAGVDRADRSKQELLMQIKEATARAYSRLPALLATLNLS